MPVAHRRGTEQDPLGSQAFDALAITRSRILPNGSFDGYRRGKSLRERSFVVDGLADDLAATEALTRRAIALNDDEGGAHQLVISTMQTQYGLVA